MDDDYNRPISRDDLLFTVEMALRKAERFWPKKRRPGDHDRLRPVAERIVEHMELSGLKCFRRPCSPGHSTPDPWSAPGKGRAPDGANGGDDG